MMENIMNKKFLVLLLALSIGLLAVGAAGNTLAWLEAKTDAVKNTFTTSDVKVTLEETEEDFKMVPGHTIDKDPKVTVKEGSEDCWLFIKIEENCTAKKSDTENYKFDDFIAYQIDTTTEGSHWTQGKGTGTSGDNIPTNVYYRKVEGATEDKEFTILAAGSKTVDTVNYTWTENQVLTLPTVTKTMMEAANKTSDTKPALTFTAYASQLYKTNKPTGEDVTDEQITAAQFTAAEAWGIIGSGN